MASHRIIHVHLHTPKAGKSDFYFKSKRGIFKVLTTDEVGITQSSLNNTRIMPGEHYANSKCVITNEKVED